MKFDDVVHTSTMFDALRNKIQNVQSDISSSLKSLTGRKSSLNQRLSVDSLSELLHCDAGADVLAKYQKEWENLHGRNVSNIRLAEKAASKAKQCQDRVQRQCDLYHDFGYHLSQLDTLGDALSNMVVEIAEIEGLCEEVESSVALLEVVCDTQDFQDRRLDQRFQLALYREHKVAQLNETKNQLALNYLHKAEERAKHDRQLKREKQHACQKAFEEDVKLYKKTGKVPGKMVMSKSTPSVNVHSDSLSDVDLEYDPTELNDFLGLSESWSEASASKSQPDMSHGDDDTFFS